MKITKSQLKRLIKEELPKKPPGSEAEKKKKKLHAQMWMKHRTMKIDPINIGSYKEQWPKYVPGEVAPEDHGTLLGQGYIYVPMAALSPSARRRVWKRVKGNVKYERGVSFKNFEHIQAYLNKKWKNWLKDPWVPKSWIKVDKPERSTGDVAKDTEDKSFSEPNPARRKKKRRRRGGELLELKLKEGNAKITKSQFKRLIKEESKTVLEQAYDTRYPSTEEIARSYFDTDETDELEADFAGDEEADLTDDELRALELSKMYSGDREPGWLEKMGLWPSGGLEETKIKIISKLTQIIKEEIEGLLNEQVFDDDPHAYGHDDADASRPVVRKKKPASHGRGPGALPASARFPKKPLPYPSKAYKAQRLKDMEEMSRVYYTAHGGAPQDKTSVERWAGAEDDWKDTSYDPDAVYRERSFGPEEIKELAKELALQAGLRDRSTYGWQDFVEEAKEDLMRTGKSW